MNIHQTEKEQRETKHSLLGRVKRVAQICHIGVCALVLGYLEPAAAHMAFFDAGTFNGTDILTYSRTSGSYYDFGWAEGTDADLGDSHQLGPGSRMFFFTLTQPGLIDLSVIQNTEGLDPAFTLYQGKLPRLAHDDTPADLLTPVDPVTFEPIQSVIDADPSGLYLKHSGYRDTLHHTYEGQFDAFGSWSMANDAGEHATLDYVIAVSGTSDADPSRGLSWGGNGNHDTAVGTGESLLQYYLQPGIYSVAVAGERCSDESSPLCGGIQHTATFTLRVEPVPLPGAVWLFGSGLVGLVGLARRRMAMRS